MPLRERLRAIPSYFTREEAQAKMGERIRARVELAGVPIGTTGIVVRFDDDVGDDGYDLGVLWELPQGPPPFAFGELEGHTHVVFRVGKPFIDWFSRDEYERFLAVVLH